MESFFSRFKNVLVLVVVLLAQTIGLAIQVRRPAEVGAPDGKKVTLLRSWVAAAVTPFERFFHGIGHNVRFGWSNYVDLRNTRHQNQELKDEVARLRLEQAQLAEDALQGHRLQTLLNFQRSYVTSTLAAQVIGTSGTDQSRVLYIDKGANDGLKIDQAVMTPDGIVGKIRAVFPHTAQVLLVNDPTSGAGVLLESTRIRAILRGSQSGHIVITNLTPDSRIKPGEKVLTSGGDQVYPRGLSVGTIESIAPDPEHQPYTIIQVKPATNLFQLEEVLVITGTQGDLPLQAQKDLAKGAATAKEMAAAKAAAEEEAAEAAAQSAAQIIAEKLPSVHEGEQAGTDASTDAGKPAATTPAVPKPPPTLHPDRYSPGATPPASSLKPGAEHNATSYSAPSTSPSSTPAPHASRGPSQAQPETDDEGRPITPARPPQKQNQPRGPDSSSPDN
jgi:rod shape-determining protein MreC